METLEERVIWSPVCVVLALLHILGVQYWLQTKKWGVPAEGPLLYTSLSELHSHSDQLGILLNYKFLFDWSGMRSVGLHFCKPEWYLCCWPTDHILSSSKALEHMLLWSSGHGTFIHKSPAPYTHTKKTPSSSGTQDRTMEFLPRQLWIHFCAGGEGGIVNIT